MAISSERIFITGGAGFIGTSLARMLADDNELVLYDNLTHDARERSGMVDHANVTLIEGDVLDIGSLRAAAKGATMFIHMAAIAGVGSVIKSPVRTMRVNLLGTANAVDVAAENTATIRRFVDMSTSEVFGRHAYKVEETHEMRGGSVGEARWTYAVSKLAGEFYAHSYFDELDLPVSIVRPFNIYGPRQVGVGAIHEFMTRALRGEDLIVHNDGSQIRAWCYIDDIVDALLRILENDVAIGEAFNIGNPRSVCTTWDLASRIQKITGSSSQLVSQRLDYSDVEIRIPDVTKAQELLGWKPKVDLDDGLYHTMNWYAEQLIAAAADAT